VHFEDAKIGVLLKTPLLVRFVFALTPMRPPVCVALRQFARLAPLLKDVAEIQSPRLRLQLAILKAAPANFEEPIVFAALRPAIQVDFVSAVRLLTQEGRAMEIGGNNKFAPTVNRGRYNLTR
jgi:hypothetical protein